VRGFDAHLPDRSGRWLMVSRAGDFRASANCTAIDYFIWRENKKKEEIISRPRRAARKILHARKVVQLFAR
jgi:hypothetical protein